MDPHGGKLLALAKERDCPSCFSVAQNDFVILKNPPHDLLKIFDNMPFRFDKAVTQMRLWLRVEKHIFFQARLQERNLG